MKKLILVAFAFIFIQINAGTVGFGGKCVSSIDCQSNLSCTKRPAGCGVGSVCYTPGRTPAC